MGPRVNYYEHHLGDYDQATAHLSACEDGIYSRLIRWYMAEEKPLPADLKAIQRRVRAHTKEERQAVETILGEFFELHDDGYHQRRCDAEIAKYLESAPDRDAKRENERERQRRTRERRRQLFELLREHGVVPAYDAPMSELQSLASRATSPHKERDVTPPVTRDATATQTPDTRHHTPITSDSSNPRLRASRLPPDWDPGDTGFAFAASHGLANGKAQAELAKFRDYWGAKAGKDGAKLDWMGTWRNWVRTAVERGGTGPSRQAAPSAAEQRAMDFAAGVASSKPPHQSTAEVIDVSARRLG